jgi:hypothetical protein
VFQVEGEVFNLLLDGHGVDHIFVRLCRVVVCHVVELDVFYPCVRVRRGGGWGGLYTLDNRPMWVSIKVETPGFPMRGWLLKLARLFRYLSRGLRVFLLFSSPAFVELVQKKVWGRRFWCNKEIGIDSNFQLYFMYYYDRKTHNKKAKS